MSVMENMVTGPGGTEQGAVTGTEQPDTELTPLEADKQTLESLPEQKDNVLHAEQGSALMAAQASSVQSGQVAGVEERAAKDEFVIEVEKILEEGLGDFYAGLPPEAKPLFRKRGEEASLTIADMVRTLRVNVKKMVDVIGRWLQTIPGVNKFFLEQETKIKADKILELIEARKEERSTRI